MQLLPVLKENAGALTPSHEIIVIDASEPLDNTAEVCQVNGVRHVYRTGGDHYGDAVRTGIAEAQGRWILFMDADGSHNPIHLQRLWAKRESFDIVVGSRYVAGGETENPWILICMSFIVNLTFRMAFHLDCRDVTNSFRLYRGAPLRALTLQSDDFDIIEEILIRIVAGPAQGTVTEVPVVFERRKAGESKRKLMAFAASYLTTLARLRKFREAARRETVIQKSK
ncbi:MAG: glycosyltransferase [Acidobacteriota bacterium]|nr:glycosyltransferase [Acidobacteriota bacterium]